MRKGLHLWLAAIAGVLAALIVASLVLHNSFRLTAFSDVMQCVLLASAAASFVPLALRSQGRVRLFWVLITVGVAFWLIYQLFWSYYEIVLQRDVPDLCAWDVVLFLHVVPLMAALGLRPHVARDEYAARLGRLDFALLLMWWCYLYVLIVIPWQYVVPDVAAYNRNLDAVYNAEKFAFLVGVTACWITTKGHWRKLYASLFGMSLCYSAGSTFANWAIARKSYYSGSLYDIPLVSAMAFLTWIGLCNKAETPDANSGRASTVYGVWVARCSMIAVFTLPAFAAWAMLDATVPSRIRLFRIAFTLMASFMMGVMVLVRQHLLDRELTCLLSHSQDSFDSLRRLQAQVLQSEKLASIGQLVGGAAHELNNPITAMLGYSDLLLNTSLTAKQKPIAAKIGQYVRRTRLLVASLISFARQTPADKTPLDLNTLARTAVKLTQPQLESQSVAVEMQFDSDLPKVLGDANQLLQVCLQLITKCLQVLSDRGGRAMKLRTQAQDGIVTLQIATEPMASAISPEGHEGVSNDADQSLGLSACQGILQEHRGTISHQTTKDGSVQLCVELPAADAVISVGKEPIAAGLRPVRPYA